MTGPRLAQSVSNAIAQRGQLIVLRTIQPSALGPIPPILAATVLAADLLAGASTLALNCSSATGQIVAGDRLTIAGQTVAVSQGAQSRPLAAGSTPGFDGIAFAPPIANAAAAGAAVQISFAADKPLKAMVVSFPLRLVDGTNTLVGDLMVTIGAYGQPKPSPETQKLIVQGDVKTIVKVDPTYGPGGEICKWVIQAR